MSSSDFSGFNLARLCDPYDDQTFVKHLFPISILQTSVIPDTNQRSDMLSYFKSIEGSPAPSKGSSVAIDKGNYTGDVNGLGSIHQHPSFGWLVRKLEEKVLEYIKTYTSEVSSLAFFHQKSWPVILQNSQSVSRHSHDNAHVSAVYYLNVPVPSSGGNILFYNPLDSILPTYGGGTDLLKTSHHAFGLSPVDNMLIIFPSRLDHEVSCYESVSPRYSISFDVSITAAIASGSGKVENFPPHISFWKPFSS